MSDVDFKSGSNTAIRRRVRWLTERVIGLLLIVTGLAIVAQIILALLLGPSGLLLYGTAFFAGMLVIPLLLQTVFHPEIEITDSGLILRPMLWKTQQVPRENVLKLVPHPAIRNNEIWGRLLHGKNYRPREGCVVVIADSARLNPLFRLVGGISGEGNRAAFAISNTTHPNFGALRAQLSRWIEANQPHSPSESSN